MKKKTIIIISLIAVLALGSTIAFAATEDGTLINPFSKILGEKVEDGTITSEEAGVFAKVWDEIKGDREAGEFRGPGRMGRIPGFEKPELDEETLATIKAAAEEIKTAVAEKIDEVVAGLISEGYLTQEDADKFEDRPVDFWFFMKDADEATQEELKAALTEVKEYHESLVTAKIESGELTEETAGFLMGGRKAPKGCGMAPFEGERGRFPCFEEKADDDNT